LKELQAACEAQNRCCPVCGEPVELVDTVPHRTPDGHVRAVLHAGCHRLAVSLEDAGPEAVDRVLGYLWADRRFGA
jgi:hypothetical protein